MAGDWREYRIGEIADIVGGSTPSTSDPSNCNEDIPWITPKDLSGPHDRYVSRGERNLSRKGLESCSAQLLPRGTVLVTSRAPIGYVAIAKNPITTNQGFRNLVPKPGVDSEFLYYWVKANVEELRRHASGSTFQELSGTALAQIGIRLPPLPEQRAIAHILGTLDDKIGLNRRMSETLEAMARALFKAWFVDFEPVRAKMEGRWQRGQSLPVLPAHLYDLFPTRLVDSELGEIPEGWRVARLGDFVVTIKGRSYKSEELVEGSDVALVTLKSFARGGGYRPDGLKPFAGCYKQEQVVKPGEVVAACTDVTQAVEVIGRAAMVRRSSLYRELVASLDTLIVRPKTSDMTVAFLYSLLRTDAFVEHTYAHVTGTTVLHLGKDAVPSFSFALPPKTLVDVFDGIGSRIFGKIETLELESATLAALRDALLPKLIRGEIRVRDAERLILQNVPNTKKED
jgi:type I restriction enzyme S subunit